MRTSTKYNKCDTCITSVHLKVLKVIKYVPDTAHTSDSIILILLNSWLNKGIQSLRAKIKKKYVKTVCMDPINSFHSHCSLHKEGVKWCYATISDLKNFGQCLQKHLR